MQFARATSQCGTSNREIHWDFQATGAARSSNLPDDWESQSEEFFHTSMLLRWLVLVATILISGSLWAQQSYVRPDIWDHSGWRKGSFPSPHSVDATYRRIYAKLDTCLVAYSMRVHGRTR